MTSLGAGALVAAAVRANIARAGFLRLGGVAFGSPLGFLPSGHYVSKKLALAINYPQPNASVSSYSRHLWAYWDGTNDVEYRIPVGVQFGAPPYVFELIAGPPGMTIPQAYWIPGYTPAQMLALGYGDVVWHPQGNITSGGTWTVTVRVYSQDYQTDTTQYIDVTWSVTTSSSTAQFIFIDPAAPTGGTGTISSPITLLSTAFASGSFPGAIAYLRAGTHAAYAGMSLTATSTPFAVVAFPGESPVIDITNSSGGLCFGFGSNIDDFFAQGIEFTGSATANTANYQYFWLSNSNARVVFHNLSFPNVFSGANVSNNSSCVYRSDSGLLGAYNPYFYMKGCSETNRSTVGNAYALFCLYGVNYFLAELNTITNTAGHNGMYPKASTYNGERRFNFVLLVSTNTEPVLAVGGQNNADGISGNDIICYNTLIGGGGPGVKLNSELNPPLAAFGTLVSGSTTLTITSNSFSGTCTFTSGSNQFTVASVTAGNLAYGMSLSGTDFPTDPKVTSQVSGTPGGVGVYTVNSPFATTVSTPEAFTASSGALTAGMAVSGTGIPSGTTIVEQLTGTRQGIGTYEMSNAATQTVSTAEAIYGNNFVTNCWVYRNSIVGFVSAESPDVNTGPYEAESNAIQYGSQIGGVVYSLYYQPYVYPGAQVAPYGSIVTDANTEGEASSGVFDSSYNLTGSYATYAGTLGAQIQ
ncbi:MAG: hypothetical protein ACP5P4_05110 [Steroidobacteraceae bacterium]